MTYRCELCQKNCRLMDFAYASNNTYKICRCNPDQAFLSFKIKSCPTIHHLGIMNIHTHEFVNPFNAEFYT